MSWCSRQRAQKLRKAPLPPCNPSPLSTRVVLDRLGCVASSRRFVGAPGPRVGAARYPADPSARPVFTMPISAFTIGRNTQFEDQRARRQQGDENRAHPMITNLAMFPESHATYAPAVLMAVSTTVVVAVRLPMT